MQRTSVVSSCTDHKTQTNKLSTKANTLGGRIDRFIAENKFALNYGISLRVTQ